MEDILITGHLSDVPSAFIDKLTDQYKAVAASADLENGKIGRKCNPFTFGIRDEAYPKLFHSYSFESVIYFADRPENGSNCAGELADLETVLALCTQYHIKKVLFVSSTYVYDGLVSITEETEPEPVSEPAIALDACERLCRCYRRKYDLPVLILHTPSMFGVGDTHSILGSAVRQIASKNHVLLPGRPEQKIDLLSFEDFGELVLRILYDWNENQTVINVPGSCQTTLAGLGELLAGAVPASRIAFTGETAPIYMPVDSKTPRREFDWLAVVDMESGLTEMLQQAGQEQHKENPFWFKRLWTFVRDNKVLLHAIELAVGYILMELLNHVSGTTIQFRGIDYRLLFVVLFGSLHGLRTGIAAALLASLSCLFGYIGTGTDWRVIMYNVDNWMPFACYFIIGAIAGYTRDKRLDDTAFVTEEKNKLENRYIFLNELYASALQNKGQFKKQIVSYRDSFGRIFEVTKRLGTLLPEKIFKEALLILEDILDNRTISIYVMNQYASFGRLNVCSKQMISKLPKSLNMEAVPILHESLTPDTVWVNRDRLQGYPDYAYPVYRSDRLILMIMVHQATFEQMAMYFENLLKILCGLIESSLLRAQDYMEHFSDEVYLPGSHVMRPDAFKNLLRVRDEMEESAISEYALIEIETTPETIVSIAEAVQPSFRENDTLGMGDDGNLYIILSQANEKNIDPILERLERNGLLVQTVRAQPAESN